MILLLISHLIFKINRINSNERFITFVSKLSNNTNSYYIVQWIFVGFVMFICGGAGLWGSHNTPMVVGIVGIIVITISSYFIAPFIIIALKKIKLHS